MLSRLLPFHSLLFQALWPESGRPGGSDNLERHGLPTRNDFIISIARTWELEAGGWKQKHDFNLFEMFFYHTYTDTHPHSGLGAAWVIEAVQSAQVCSDSFSSHD